MFVGAEIEVLLKKGTGIKRYYGEVLKRLPALRPEWRFVYLGPDTADPRRQRRILEEITEDMPMVENLTAKAGRFPGPLQTLAGGRIYDRWKLLRFLARRIDVFYTTMLPGYYSRRFRTTIALQDIIPVLHPEVVAPETTDWLTRNLHEWTRKAHLIFTPSESVKADVVNYCGVNPGKIIVAPGAVDPDTFRPRKKEEAREMLKRRDIHEPFVLYAGRLDTWKNIPSLVGAFAKLTRKHDVPHKLLVAGMWQRSLGEIRERIAAEKVEGLVHLLCYIPEEELPLLYNLADCFVFPSWYEGFGIPVIEAMASGCPVVTSTTAALHETAGGAALEVDPADVDGLAEAIHRVLTDQQLRAELVRKGLGRAQQLSWEKTARITAEALETLS